MRNVDSFGELAADQEQLLTMVSDVSRVNDATSQPERLALFLQNDHELVAIGQARRKVRDPATRDVVALDPLERIAGRNGLAVGAGGHLNGAKRKSFGTPAIRKEPLGMVRLLTLLVQGLMDGREELGVKFRRVSMTVAHRGLPLCKPYLLATRAKEEKSA
jgi:hypothetical protein